MITGQEVIVLEPIVFPRNTSELTPEAVSILDTVAGVLIKHPEFSKLEASGHAEPQAEEDALTLSRARAERIVAELVLRGVPKDRLMTGAYSAHCPRKDDDPARNARVEFKVVAVIPDGPTNVRRGCPAATAAGLSPLPVDQR